MQTIKLVFALGIIVAALVIVAGKNGGGQPHLSMTAATNSIGSPARLHRLVSLTDSGRHLLESGLKGFAHIQGLAFDPHRNVYYATDSSGKHLIGIDRGTGITRAIGPLGFKNVRGLAFDPHTKTLYGTVSFPSVGELITIDPNTGSGTAVGRLGFRSVEGLAFDTNTHTLYGTDARNGQLLLTIDTSTGVGTAVAGRGSLGFAKVAGLTFDPISNTLYGTSTYPNPGQLVTIDPVTGVGTAAGAGFSHIRGLAFDAKPRQWLARTTPTTTHNAYVLTTLSKRGENPRSPLN